MGAHDCGVALAIHALEFMVDDYLRELFVIRNPNLAGVERDFDALAHELSVVWFRTLFPDRARDGDRGIEFAPAKRGAAPR